MSRIHNWKPEKTKVKVVFRLQFHATHIPQPGWDRLLVSFISADTGKVTAKTNKANARNGNCKWSDPIYETTRLLLDPRTKKYDEKLYKLVVAMGSSRSNLLGEVIINLADFVDALKPSSLALPLHGCDFGTVLHVTVQLLSSKTGFREFEQQRELSVKGFQMPSSQRSHNPDETLAASSETISGQMDKVIARVRFKSSTELASLEEVGESNEDYEDSAAGVDGSSYTSDSLNAEKNDFSSTHEVDGLKSPISGDVGRFSLSQNRRPEKQGQHGSRLSTQGSNDWTHGWSSDYSGDNDLAIADEENNRLRERLEVAESAFSQLKSEAKSLQHITDELGAETQSLAQRYAIELASGEQLTREVSVLKSECSRFKNDLEELKSANITQQFPDQKTPFPLMMKCDLADTSIDGKLRGNVVSAGQDYMFHDQQVRWLQGLMLIEGKVREIQDKACLEYHGSDFGFLHDDFKVLECVLEDLKRGIIQGEGLDRSYRDHHYSKNMVHSIGDSHQLFDEQGPLNRNPKASNTMEEKICELLQKLEESKTDKENLTKKMAQMECYYEAFIHELEENQKQTIKELESLRNEHSSCLYASSVLQGEIEKMHQEMNEQLTRFAEDRNSLECHNKELEKRAVAAETALKRVRRNYTMAVDRLQKDLELLSFQVLSMYETNENLTKQAFTDASHLSYGHRPEEYLGKTQSCIHDDGVLTSFPEGPYMPAVTRNQTEIMSTKSSHEDGVPRSVDYLGGGVSYREVPVNVELQTKTESHANGWKLDNTGQAASQNNHIQVEKTLIFSRDMSPEKQINKELPENYITPKSMCDSQLSYNPEGLRSQSQNAEAANQQLNDSDCAEEMNMSPKSKELQSNIEAEISEMHLLNMHLKVFSEVLQETLRDVIAGVTCMNCKMVELVQQLEHSTDLKESLILELHNSLDEARLLKEGEANLISKCDDLTVKNQILEAKLQDVSDENTFLTQKVAECEQLKMECIAIERKFKVCAEERNEFENLLKQESLQKCDLQKEIGSVAEDLKALNERFNEKSTANDDLLKSVTYFQDILGNLYSNMISCTEQIDGSACGGTTVMKELENKNYLAIASRLEQFQQQACEKILRLLQEKKVVEEQRDTAQFSLGKLESQIIRMKQRFTSDLEEVVAKLKLSDQVGQNLQLELLDVSEKLKFSLAAEEKNALENRILSSNLVNLETELKRVTDENRDLAQKLLVFDSVNEELERTKLNLMNCMQENQILLMSVQSGNEASKLLEIELRRVEESLRSTHQDLQIERKLKEELKAESTDLKSRLKEKDQQLLSFNENRTELVNLRERVLDLETVNNELQHLLLRNEESQRKLKCENLAFCSQAANAENEFIAILGNSLAAEFKVTYMTNQFYNRVHELVGHLKILEGDLEKLHSEHKDVVTLLEAYMTTEAQLVDDNARLSADLQLLKSELEIVVHEKEGLVNYIKNTSANFAEDKDMKAGAAKLEADGSREKQKYEEEIWRLKNMLISYEEELDTLRSSTDELEITNIILRSNLDEQQSRISSLEESDHELRKLREQHNELGYKLSEQILKTEELKNLSIHLRELKDKADVECDQAREKRDSEGSSFAMQESLRIAFIKEQYESKIQELKNQLFVSKRYAEEMLFKLQNALDEVESGKKNEASLAKKIEELLVKISDLEADLQIALSDKKELVKVYDRTKAELECCMLCLDCCKEEKLKLEASLQECNEDRTKIRVELDLVKRLLENMVSTEVIQSPGNLESGAMKATSIAHLLEDGQSGFSVNLENPNVRGIYSGEDTETAAGLVSVDNVGGDELLDTSCMSSSCRDMERMQPAHINESLNMNPLPSSQALQDKSTFEQIFLKDKTKDFPGIEEHLKEKERLKIGMDLLQKELAKLRNANLSSLLRLEDADFDPSLQRLQRELSQLDMANEHLGRVFPSFKELPVSGNALERVLALELELAEALQTKKKSEICFQSSFLKQHNDEEAVFQSFRDINELIQETLELKRRHATLETELKEMQGRYSQLSLQFAEVEGERQKLIMTLKNRTPKK